MVNIIEAGNWSVARLKFEIETLEREYDRQKRDFREIEEDYLNETPETNPGAFDRHGFRLAAAAPCGLDIIPRQLESIQDDIDKLRNILRGKL